MGIGEKIKEYRMKNNMTQKDLADQLHVTNQAVSRWENDEAEPSFDTLRAMASIFKCTANDLFSMKTEERVPNEKKSKPETVEQKVSLPVLALCENCNKPIYDSKDIHRFEKRIRQGKGSIVRSCLYCTACNTARLKEEEEKRKAEREKEVRIMKKDRIKSFVWSGIISFLLLLGSIVFLRSDKASLISGIVTSLLAFTFASCLFLRNNFLEDLWFDISEWGFVRMPGVIMEFSLDGIIVGFLIKLILLIFGWLLGLFTTILATIIAMILSPFTYPFALAKNIKECKKDYKKENK